MIVRHFCSHGVLPLDANLDKTNIGAILLIIFLASVTLVLNPELRDALVQESYAFIAEQFGWLYALGGVAAMVVLLWLAFGRFGEARLGVEGETGVQFQL